MAESIAKLNLNVEVTESDCILAIYLYQSYLCQRYPELRSSQLGVKPLVHLETIDGSPNQFFQVRIKFSNKNCSTQLKVFLFSSG